MKILLFFFCAATIHIPAFSIDTFSYFLTGYEAQYASQSVATDDGGHLVLGNILGLPNSFRYNAILLKLNQSGQIEWKKVLSPGDPWAISKTKDGGFVVTLSKAVVKLNRNGDVEWQTRLGYLYYSSRQTSAGSYVAVGGSFNKTRITMMNPDGNVQWDRTYKVCFSSFGTEILEAPDGGFLVTGGADCGANGTFYLLKIDTAGRVLWQRGYLEPAAAFDVGAMARTKGGYVLLGRNQFQEVTVLKIDQRGAIRWQKKFPGGGLSSDADTIYKTADGGIVFRNAGDQVTKLDANGNPQWVKKYRTNRLVTLRDVYPRQDGLVFSVQLGDEFFVFKTNQNGSTDSSVCVRVQDLPVTTLPSEITILPTPTVVTATLPIRRLTQNARILPYPATLRKCP